VGNEKGVTWIGQLGHEAELGAGRGLGHPEVARRACGMGRIQFLDEGQKSRVVTGCRPSNFYGHGRAPKGAWIGSICFTALRALAAMPLVLPTVKPHIKLPGRRGWQGDKKARCEKVKLPWKNRDGFTMLKIDSLRLLLQKSCMQKAARSVKYFLCLVLAGLSAGLCAGQVQNGDFHDSATFGDDNSWNQIGNPLEFNYASPGQTGAGNCIYFSANNADTITAIAQDVAISSGPTVPFLDFYYVAQNGDGNVAGGGQTVQILNTSNGVQTTVFNVSQNSPFGWVHAVQNLSAYVGQTVRLFFEARGSAGHGATLYLDTVSINYATYTPTATITPSITKSFTRSPSSTVSPSSTQTPTVTASPTASLSPSSTPSFTPTPYPDQVQNGGFENGSGYDQWTANPNLAQMQIRGPGSDGTGQAAYVQGYGGANYSALQQIVHVDNVGNPQLIFWYMSLFGSGDTSQAYSFFDIRTTGDVLLQRIVGVSRRDTSWNQVTFDLSGYVGQDIELCFGAAVPGSQTIAIEVDNVSIYYGTPTITPSVTATSTSTSTVTATRTATATITPSRTPTDTGTLTATPTITQTCTVTASNTPSVTPTDTPTRTATATITQTRTMTATATVSPSVTVTFSVTRTYSASPTATITPSITRTSTVTPTFTATPPFLKSGLGRNVAAPVPARGHDDICVYFERQPAQSEWKVFNIAGESVARLNFGAEYAQCWNHRGIAPGIYILMLDTSFADGTTEKNFQKLAILP
jgi:hypothetical protein